MRKGRSLAQTRSFVSNVSDTPGILGEKKRKKNKNKTRLMARILRLAHTFSHDSEHTLRIEGHLFDE